MDLDPQVRRWLEAFPPPDPQQPRPSIAEMRRTSNEWPVGERPPVFAVVDTAARADGREVPVRIYRPNDRPDLPVIVFLHGGGWVMGGIELVDVMCRRLTNAVTAVVVSVGYRLAPEHPFPQPLDDVIDVLRWAQGNGTALGGDPTRMAIVGESAGGNLAACAALRVADEGGPPLVHQALLYPVLDHDFERPSMKANAEGYGLTAEAMEWFWDRYVPDSSQRDDPYVSPRNGGRDRLGRVAPATVITAGFDPLCDEGDEYAQLLAAAAVPVNHARFGDQIHGFLALGDGFTGASAGWNVLVAAMIKAFLLPS